MIDKISINTCKKHFSVFTGKERRDKGKERPSTLKLLQVINMKLLPVISICYSADRL